MSSTQDPSASSEKRDAADGAARGDKDEMPPSAAVASTSAAKEPSARDVKKEDDGESMDIDAVTDAAFEKSDSEAPTIVLSNKSDRDGHLQDNNDRHTASPASKEARAVKQEGRSSSKQNDVRRDRRPSEGDSIERRKEGKASAARSTTPKTTSKDTDYDRSSKKRKTPDDDDEEMERRVRSAGPRSRRERSLDDTSRERRDLKKLVNSHRRTQPASSHERSMSPPVRAHRRTASATNSSTAGGSHTKRRANIPPPLRPTRDASYSEASSDSEDSSVTGRHFIKAKRASSGTGAAISPAKIPHRRNRDQNGRTQLARACASGDVSKVKIQLADRPEDLDEVDYAGTLPIHEASLKGYAPVVRILLDAKCAFDRANGDGDTPLIDAVENGHLEVVRLLLEAGADPRKRNKAGEEPYDLVDQEDDNYNVIREELRAARKRFAARRTSEDEGGRGSVGPDSGRSSRDVSTFSPRHSPPAGVRTPPSSITSSRRRTGRHESTRNDMLWFEASKVTPDHLRAAAVKGDYQMVVQIIQSGLQADIDSMTAAAKAGHVDILNLLLAIGQGDADPDPLRRDVKISKKGGDSVPFKPGHNTPMLAAIGRGNLEVIKLLLAQSGFDARRRAYKGKSYYELAEERQGVDWEKEAELLRTAYDEQETKQVSPKVSKHDRRELSPNSRRISKSEKLSTSEKKKLIMKERDSSSLKERDRERELKKERKMSRASPSRSVSGHDKRDDDASDRDEVKKRRKLVSGKDIRNDRVKERRTTSDPVSTLKKHRSPRPESPSRQKSSESKKSKHDKHDTDVDMLDAPLEPPKSHHDSEKRAARKEGSIKRSRHSSSPPRSESPEAMSRSQSRDPAKKKKRRLEGDGESKSSKEHRPTLVKSSSKLNSHQSADADQREDKPKKDRTLSEKKERASEDRPRDADRQRDSNAEPKSSKKSANVDEDRPKKADKPAKESSKHEELKVKKVRPPEKTEAEKEAEEQAKAAKIAAEKEKQRVEEEKRKAEAEKQQKLLEEQLEAERQEKIRREEAEKAERLEKAKIAEQKARAEAEARKKRELERIRLEDEARERKRLELEAERQRELQRLEEQRLAALPQAIREAARQTVTSAEDIKCYLPIFWANLYPTYHHPIGATPRPKETYMTNIQAAMILGIRDLQLSQYTSWDRRPLSDHERSRVWSVMRNMLSGRPDISVPMPIVAEHVEKQKRKFMAMNDVFWIRLSDFEHIIHLHPHLTGADLKFIEIDMADGTRHGFFSALPSQSDNNNKSASPAASNHQAAPTTNGDFSVVTSPHLNPTAANGPTTNGAVALSHT